MAFPSFFGGSNVSGSPGSGGGFSSAVGSFFGGVGDFLGGFAGSTLGGQFLGDLGSLAVNKLRSVTGLQPSVVGNRFQVGTPLNQFELSQEALLFAARQAAAGQATSAQLAAAQAAQLNALRAQQLQVEQQLQDQRTRQLIADRDAAIFGFSSGGGTRVLPPFIPPQSIPAQSPGGVPVAFPVDRSAGFPVSAVTNALFNPQGFPVAQQASLAGLGAGVVRQLPGLLGGFLLGEGVDALSAGGAGGGTPLFKIGCNGTSAHPVAFRAPNPVTGKDEWFRPAGRPILFSGDFTAARRVSRVAKMAKKRLGARR